MDRWTDEWIDGGREGERDERPLQIGLTLKKMAGYAPDFKYA